MVSAFQTRVKIVREVLEVNNSACDLSVYVSDAVVPADLSTQATSDVLLRTRSGTPVPEAQSPAQVVSTPRPLSPLPPVQSSGNALGMPSSAGSRAASIDVSVPCSSYVSDW